jgi:hypothetical protein
VTLLLYIGGMLIYTKCRALAFTHRFYHNGCLSPAAVFV